MAPRHSSKAEGPEAEVVALEASSVEVTLPVMEEQSDEPADGALVERTPRSKDVVVVLGMHRSGTSLLANILHLLGADVLSEAPLKSAKNPTGFWERPDILAVQDEILALLGRPVGAATHCLPLPAGWWRDPALNESKAKLRTIVQSRIAEGRRWGFKDPRTCRLLPLWIELFEDLGVQARWVWAIRRPAESAVSMKLKNPKARPMTERQGELLWLAYNYDVLRHVGGLRPTIVPYDDWFKDAVGTAERLGAELDLRWHGARAELTECLDELIQPDHRHHWTSDAALQAGIPISDQIYDVLSRAAKGETPDQVPALHTLEAVFRAVEPFAEAADGSAKLAAERDQLAKACETLKAELATAADQVGSQRRALATRIADLDRQLDDASLRLRATETALDHYRKQLEETQAALAERTAERDQLRVRLEQARKAPGASGN